MNLKKLSIEILVIIGISAFLGIAYNFYSSKPLALIRTPEKLTFSNESDIFANNADSLSGNQIKDTSIAISQMQEINKDSLNKANKIKADSLAKIDSAKADINNHKSEYINLTILKKHLNDPRLVLVDARPSNLFDAGHIKGAINIYPLQDDTDHYLRSLMELDRSKTIVVYCDGGTCDLSHDVYKDLKNFSYNHVFIYHGGWEEWSRHAVKRQ